MLALLRYLTKISVADRGLLENWHCVYVQHILRSNVDCIEFLREFGLGVDRLHVFGKSYSTNLETLADLRSQQIAVHCGDELYNFDEPFDEHIVRAVEKTIREIQAQGGERLLLIDEGGIAARALSSALDLPFQQVAIAELTARGAQQYNLVSSLVPVVDVARSETKKKVESKIIGESMVLSLKQSLDAFGSPPLGRLSVGLLGVGAIGQAIIAEFDRLGVPLLFFDRDENRPRNCSLDEVSGAQLILSATGGGSDLFLPGKRGTTTLLVNCGSSDVEYQLWSIRRQAEKVESASFMAAVPGKPWRGPVLFTIGDSQRVFLRGGFPVNFDGSPDPIPADKISITRAALMAGALQAVKESSPGVIALSESIQRLLQEEYARLAT